jgi:hypothetical protein
MAGAILAGLTLAGAGLAACGDESPTTERTTPASVPTAQRKDVARRAQALVAIEPRELGYELRLEGARDEIRARADLDARTITLFLRRGDPVDRVAHDLAHEIGHAYDDRRMTEAGRRDYLARRGVPDAPWLPGDEASDLDSGAGDFAEVFALCSAASPEFRSRLAPRPEVPCEELPIDARRVLTR